MERCSFLCSYCYLSRGCYDIRWIGASILQIFYYSQKNLKINLAFLSNIVYTIKGVQLRALTTEYGEVF